MKSIFAKAAERGGVRNDYLPPRFPALSSIFSMAATGTRRSLPILIVGISLFAAAA
jgi:hypothetical protein